MSNPSTIHCPQCGAPAPFRGTTVSLVCEYCDSTIVRSGADIELVGKVSALVDTGSPVLLGASGKWEGRPFQMTGRLQVEYARGTWNEWHLRMDHDAEAWLSEAQGNFAIVEEKDSSNIDVAQLPPFTRLEAGVIVSLGATRTIVTDYRSATYLGAEGELPFEARPGQKFYSADLNAVGSDQFFTLDYGSHPEDSPSHLYEGRRVNLLDLQLNPLRSFEGWKAKAKP